jgi:hypothetical protein
VGFVACAWFTAVGRVADYGVESASQPRYIYVAAALFLPLVALGAQALTRRWVGFAAAPLILLAIGLPANIDLLVNRDPFGLGAHDLIAASAHSDLLPQIPPNTRLFPWPDYPALAPTAGWLRTAAAQGRISKPRNPTGSLLAEADAHIALSQAGGAASHRECPLRPSPLTTGVDRGDRIVFSGSIIVVVVRGNGSSLPRQYSNARGDAVGIRAGPLDVKIGGLGNQPPAVCNIERGATRGRHTNSRRPQRATRSTGDLESGGSVAA